MRRLFPLGSSDKDGQVHRFHLADNRPERHVRNNVALEIDSGRNLNQPQAIRIEPENAALRHIQHFLPLLTGIAGRKRNTLHGGDKLSNLAGLYNAQLSIIESNLPALRVESAAE